VANVILGGFGTLAVAMRVIVFPLAGVEYSMDVIRPSLVLPRWPPRSGAGPLAYQPPSSRRGGARGPELERYVLQTKRNADCRTT
jgi:hypothetical protein